MIVSQLRAYSEGEGEILLPVDLLLVASPFEEAKREQILVQFLKTIAQSGLWVWEDFFPYGFMQENFGSL